MMSAQSTGADSRAIANALRDLRWRRESNRARIICVGRADNARAKTTPI